MAAAVERDVDRVSKWSHLVVSLTRVPRSPDRTQTTAGHFSSAHRSHLLNTVVVRARPQTERATDSGRGRSVRRGGRRPSRSASMHGATSPTAGYVPSSCSRKGAHSARSGASAQGRSCALTTSADRQIRRAQLVKSRGLLEPTPLEGLFVSGGAAGGRCRGGRRGDGARRRVVRVG